jgi:DNA-binding NtrC family response regulator
MLARDALAALQAFSFPRNVRELENIPRARHYVDHQRRDARCEYPAPANAGDSFGYEYNKQSGTWRSFGGYRARGHYQGCGSGPLQRLKVLGMSFHALRYRIKKLGIE